MRILVKLAIRRQANCIAITRTRLSDTGQVGTGFDSIGYGPDLSGTVAFGAVAISNQKTNTRFDHSKCHRNYDPQRLVRPMIRRVQLDFT